MKFKDEAIKPGMVINCPKEKNIDMLLSELKNLGYHWCNGDDPTEYSGIANGYNCFRLLEDMTIKYSNYSFYEKRGYKITDFSDLIEPEPRFKVGDRVKVRNDLKAGEVYGGITLWKGDMSSYRGTRHTVGGISKSGRIEFLDDKTYSWSDEMLEPADDSPINSDADSPMSAVEVLEWLRDNDGKQAIRDVFGCTYYNAVMDNNTAQEVVDKITAYEAAKKAPKPVEVEWVYRVRIFQSDESGNRTYAFEQDIYKDSQHTVEEIAENILRDYASGRDFEYFAVIEKVCRVKKGES